MTTKWDVLLPMEIDPSGPESMSEFARCTGMDEYGSYDAALEDIGRYDAVIVRVATLDADVIDRADRLRVIAKHGSGLDNVDIEAASERGIVVCNTPGANARSVGEHAVALLFAVRRNLRGADEHVRSGEWDRSSFTGRGRSATPTASSPRCSEVPIRKPSPVSPCGRSSRQRTGKRCPSSLHRCRTGRPCWGGESS
jgi:D-3-phosphoglycerate dehydrogenase